jgi:hypothetical protein
MSLGDWRPWEERNRISRRLREDGPLFPSARLSHARDVRRLMILAGTSVCVSHFRQDDPHLQRLPSAITADHEEVHGSLD